MNRITNNSVVTLAYTVLDSDENMIDAGKEPLKYLHGGYEEIFLPIEAALQGKAVGDSLVVKLQPADAFGEYDPEFVNMVAVTELPQPLTIGMQIEGNPEDGGKEDRFFVTVTDIADGQAILDGNHPLAGVSLIFNCTVLAVRQATGEEIIAARGKGAQENAGLQENL